MAVKRVRGIRIDRTAFDRQFAKMISGGPRVTYTQLWDYFLDCCSKAGKSSKWLSQDVILKIVSGGVIQYNSVDRFRQVTGINLHDASDSRPDSPPAWLTGILSHYDLTQNRMIADAARMKTIFSELEVMIRQLVVASHNQYDMTAEERGVAAKLAGQVAGSLQTLRIRSSDESLRIVTGIGMSFAGMCRVHDERAYHIAFGWLCWNFPGPGWDKWSRVGGLMEDAEVEYWETMFAEAETHFRRAGIEANASEITLAKISRLRNLIQSRHDCGPEIDRCVGELADRIGPKDLPGIGLLKVLQSHAAEKRGRRRRAVDFLQQARNSYLESAVPGRSRFVAECDLRLAELGLDRIDFRQVLETVQSSSVVNSQIVDLHPYLSAAGTHPAEPSHGRTALMANRLK